MLYTDTIAVTRAIACDLAVRRRWEWPRPQPQPQQPRLLHTALR